MAHRLHEQHDSPDPRDRGRRLCHHGDGGVRHPPGARRLGGADGLPPLGTIDIVLCQAPGVASKAGAILAEHIRLSLRPYQLSTLTSPLADTVALPGRGVSMRPAKIAARTVRASQTG